MENATGCPDVPIGTKATSLKSMKSLGSGSDDTSGNKAYGNSSFRSIRKALGVYGSVAIIGGTATTLGVIGFLIFLWTGEGSDDGKSALSTWRFIVLGQWLTQAITLAALVLQVTSAAQASVCTGLIAAMILERQGVAVSRVAEYSLIRSNNDGPFRLSWLLLSSLRRSLALQTFLAVALLFGSIAIQLSSTVLVSDLTTLSIVANARNDSRGVSATFETLNQFHLINQYYLNPPFQPFGEVSGKDATPNSNGVSDTGIVRRIHPFLPQANRSTTRQYRGRGFVFNSRVVCLPPSIDQPVLAPEPLNNPSWDLDFIPYLSGRIAYNQTFQDAAMEPPSVCPLGTCFPSAFNCTVAVRTNRNGRPGISLCIPSGKNAPLPSYNSTISDIPVANTSEVFLFLRSDIDFNTTFGSSNTSSLLTATQNDEWTAYRFDNGITLNVSMCFQQLHYDRATVHLTTDQNLQDGSVQWNANSTQWETSSVKKLFGLSDNQTAYTDAVTRGIYYVEEISNISRSSTTASLTSTMITDSYGSFENGNVTMNLSPYGGGSSTIMPHISYQALFADTVEQIGRPAVAFQNLITALSGSMIDGLLTQLDVMEDITTVSSVPVSAPNRYLGLAFVLTISVINLTTVVTIVSLFLVRTEHTSAGNYWHAVAQIVSDITQPIIHRATQATDDEITEMLKDYDIDIRIQRNNLSGRVEAVTHDDTDM